MCGIAGQLAGADARVRPMIEALQHRGPDGIRVEETVGAAFAHARLSIIDLEGGWQPMHAAGGTVIGNGEIYNYLELARDHGLEDVLATGSDFEPLLHLYAREGEAAQALEHCPGAQGVVEGQQLLRGVFFQRPAHQAGGEEGPRLRGEGKAPGVLHDVERLDAERVAGQPGAAVRADQAERIHASQPLERRFALAGVEMQQRLEVGAGR